MPLPPGSFERPRVGLSPVLMSPPLTGMCSQTERGCFSAVPGVEMTPARSLCDRIHPAGSSARPFSSRVGVTNHGIIKVKRDTLDGPDQPCTGTATVTPKPHHPAPRPGASEPLRGW